MNHSLAVAVVDFEEAVSIPFVDEDAVAVAALVSKF